MSAEAERLALQLRRAVRTRVAGVGSGGWEMKMQRQCLGFDCWAESAFFCFRRFLRRGFAYVLQVLIHVCMDEAGGVQW